MTDGTQRNAHAFIQNSQLHRSLLSLIMILLGYDSGVGDGVVADDDYESSPNKF